MAKADKDCTSCYHIWVTSHTGVMRYMIRKCYTRSTANTTASRGVIGENGAQRVESKKNTHVSVEKCAMFCPCGSFRKGCRNPEKRGEFNYY